MGASVLHLVLIYTICCGFARKIYGKIEWARLAQQEEALWTTGVNILLAEESTFESWV